MAYIYIYSKHHNLCDYAKESSNKGKLLFEMLNISELNEYKLLINKSSFVLIKNRILLRLKELMISYSSNDSLEKYYNEDTIRDYMYIEKKIFDKKVKLFQGGNQLLILALSNLLDLIESSMKNDDDYIIVFCFPNHMDHRKYILSQKK